MALAHFAGLNLILGNGFNQCYFCGSKFKAFDKSTFENAFNCHAFHVHRELWNSDEENLKPELEKHSKCSGECAREQAVHVELNEVKEELFLTKLALLKEKERECSQSCVKRQSVMNDMEELESLLYLTKRELNEEKERSKHLYSYNRSLLADYQSERNQLYETQRQLEIMQNRYQRLQALVDRSNPQRGNAA